MLAGKMAGYCTKLFGESCWAYQEAWIAKGDDYDEFEVRPSERSIEAEIENLLTTDQATRADMAVALQGLRREVAERRRSEEALKESEGRFRDLAETLPEMVFEADFRGRLTFANTKAFEVFGYTEAEFEELAGD